MLENEKFVQEHPEVDAGKLVTVTIPHFKERPNSLYEIFEHIQKCPKCKKRYERAIALKKWET